jgi:hypothetical protein
MSDLVDLAAAPPPVQWGVVVDEEAIASLADRWAGNAFPLPSFDYPGTPVDRDESWWFDYVVLATSVLACLWPPEGDAVWQTPTVQGDWVDDAPAIFAVFTRTLGTNASNGIDLARFANLDRDQGHTLFAGRGTLQLIDERLDILRAAASAILDRWDGSAAALVAAAGRNGRHIAQLLTETVPGYNDRPNSPLGVLPFDKLAHLAAALMAAGVGWSAAGFDGYDDFPVYPDYMLPRVFRHHRVFVYAPELARRVDQRQLIGADSPEEHAIRWATVYAGAALRRELHDRDNPVTAPALDYHLWSEAVLGPDAGSFGEHHRTLTLKY